MPSPRQHLALATFWFDGARERVEGWTDGSTWNNWGVPLFDAEQLSAAIRALEEVGFRVTRRGATLWLEHEDESHASDYPSEKIAGTRYWRMEGLTWNYEQARNRRSRGGVREAGGLTLGGWSVGYHDEISAHAAVRRPTGERDLLFVMTTPEDREPRSLDEEVVVGLYLFDGENWDQIAYQDFPDVRAAIRLSDAELQLAIVHGMSTDQSRALLEEDFFDWLDDPGHDVSIMSRMSAILEDAGVHPDRDGVEGAGRGAIEQIRNASPAQILAYMNTRSDAVLEE